MKEHGLITVEHPLFTADGGRCHLLEVRAPERAQPDADVLLVPGMFTARGFWLSSRGIGLAAFLARNGIRCWILERRGMGSARDASAKRLGLEEARRYDIPAAWQHIQHHSGKGTIFLAGHSFGGVLAARALADGLPGVGCAGLITFAAQCEIGKAALHPPLSWLNAVIARAFGRIPARFAGLGPEDEPGAAMLDAIAWTTAAQRDGAWLQSLHVLTLVPQLAFAGGGDSVDPPEGCARFAGHMAGSDSRYHLLSRANGWAEDYTHAGMVISRSAQAEVWPVVRDWIVARI